MQKLLIYILAIAVIAGFDSDSKQPEYERSMVITIDDLPMNSLKREVAYQKEITQKLLTTLSSAGAPALGFVNESKLYENNAVDPERVHLLQMWLDAGLTLGNHTFSHPDYHLTDFQQFRIDIEQGEHLTAELLSKRNKELRYFRHPFLHVGNTPEKKEKLHNYLKASGYISTPVTIDNSEWIFARAYELALMDRDKAMMSRIGEAYISYMEAKTAYYEKQSSMLFGREIGQVLLIHANALNGDYLDELIVMLKQRGYVFETLDEVLKDPAYQSPDSYTGEGGISWIHRWALTQGKKGSFFAGEPATPDFVMQYSEIFNE